MAVGLVFMVVGDKTLVGIKEGAGGVAVGSGSP